MNQCQSSVEGLKLDGLRGLRAATIRRREVLIKLDELDGVIWLMHGMTALGGEARTPSRLGRRS
jgi:hypothetical protein